MAEGSSDGSCSLIFLRTGSNQHISFGDCFALPEELQDWVGAAPPSFSELQHRGRQGLLGGAYDKDGAVSDFDVNFEAWLVLLLVGSFS